MQVGLQAHCQNKEAEDARVSAWQCTHLLRVGAEAAAAALHAGPAAHTAPVCLLPRRVPVGLGVVIKAPSEARVVPPVVLVFLEPGGGSQHCSPVKPL